jgi:hypothetical protein
METAWADLPHLRPTTTRQRQDRILPHQVSISLWWIVPRDHHARLLGVEMPSGLEHGDGTNYCGVVAPSFPRLTRVGDLVGPGRTGTRVLPNKGAVADEMSYPYLRILT